MRVLVTGATGYIGGRLVPVLLERGHTVRCAARTPAKLDARSWRDAVEVVTADVTDPASLHAACEDVDVVYMLVHAMDGAGNFAERDREAARNVREAAGATGVRRIVYLGGLGRDDEALSEHLRSRHEVGRILASGSVPVTELRAAIIIGSGSASFEMLRHLVEVLPVMTTPRWVTSRCQPIAVSDVLFCLAEVLEQEMSGSEVIEIGGPEVYTYAELMQAYARVAGLRRRVILTVPLLTPWLSSLWIGLVTPLPTGLARPLVESLINDVVVSDDRGDRLLPARMITFEESVRLALRNVQDLDVATTWTGAGRLPGPHERVGPRGAAPEGPEGPQPADPAWSGGVLLTDERRAWSAAAPTSVFDQIVRIGGSTGYHSVRWLWQIRGLLDKLAGGIGIRRGRRHPHELAVGDAVDFWRVEALDPPWLLRLRAEMRLPGEAWLEFRVGEFRGGTRIVQRARFHPHGLWGRLYWAALLPFHGLIFPRMARELARRAEVAEGLRTASRPRSDALRQLRPRRRRRGQVGSTATPPRRPGR